MRILLIEDNEDDAIILSKMLTAFTKDGLVLRHCTCLRDGCSTAASQSFDVVLLDLGLPESKGLDTLERFLSLRVQCPVLVLTDAEDHELALESLIYGAQDYLVKGRVTQEVLARSIAYAISRQGPLTSLQKEKGELETRVNKRTEELTWANRALRESETRLNLAVKAGAVGTWDLDVHAGTMVWNEQMYQFFGVTPSEYHGTYKEIIALIHPEDRPGVEQAVAESLETGKSFSVEHRVVWPDNSVHHIAARGEVYSNKGLSSDRMIGVCLDVSHRKETEQALQEVVEDLNRSNSDLEQFAYVASHDLKEPLRMVASYTRLLAEEYEDLLDEEGKKYIHYATDGARRMQELIDDLLAYSRIGRTTGIPRPVDLNCVMRDVRENLSVTLTKCGGVLEVCENLPTVRGCGSLLSGLLQNLIANALKFHGDEPPVVMVSCEQQDGECICSVRDNGIGIPPEHRDRIFQVFQRLHARSKYEGTGIGLAICKKAVDHLGGRIWVESTPGHGSTFCFALPLAQATEFRVDKEATVICASPATNANALRSSWLKTTPETST